MLRAAAFNRRPGGLAGKDCPECLNKGQIMIAYEDGSTAIRECGCMSWRRSVNRLERSGLKELVQRCRFDTFQAQESWQQEAKKTAEGYAADPAGRWFLATGRPGSGKTHLCVAICRELMLRGAEVRYMLWRDTVTRLKAVVNDAQEYARLMEPLKRVQVLYIDDLFKTGKGQAPTAADANVAFELLNARYVSREKLTILSTERSIEEMMDIDEAVGSRIYERSRGCGIALEGEGKNWRLAQ
jgi:DNA replication protein DnaC